MMLLLASYYFYMCWKAEYVVLIMASTLVDYYAGIQMGRQDSKLKRRKYLILSLITNLGLLFSFKYANFFNSSFQTVLSHFNIFYDIPGFSLLLPVGISFYTFQTLSYSIDVYRGIRKPERHLGIFALYVSFFPQLVAGPIERSQRLLPQFYKKHEFDYQRVTSGLKLMAWGFFKKLVIADRVAVYVNAVYGDPQNFTGAPVILATYFFAIQIYCDFSGYSDIAIGAARVMGYDLMKNFRRPYFSASISEFWGRWHISLSTWFKDYVYIPLGGNRVLKYRWFFNLFITFLISGLWHGANWTFVLWGALHGFYLIFSIVTKGVRVKLVRWVGLDRYPNLHRALQVLVTFSLVTFAWIIFRANTLSDAVTIIKNIILINLSNLHINVVDGMPRNELIIAFCAIGFMECVHWAQSRGSIIQMVANRSILVRFGIYYVFVASIILFGKFGVSEFIYFQF